MLTSPPDSHKKPRIPAGIWVLGFVSMLMDVSSEMIHGLLPVFMVTVMGTSVAAVGLIEGIAEATASITKVFSGALSDWLGMRKFLTVLGYGLAAVTKPVFPLASHLHDIAAARFIDRIGKGIRGAPRDALIADIAPADLRGASFGLRQSLDTVGAFVGPAIAIALMWLTADNVRLVFWIAVIPAFLALALLIAGVSEPKVERRKARNPLSAAAMKQLGARFWVTAAIAAIATLARFSEAFLILKAQAAGLPFALAPLVLVVMNVVYAASAYPAGVISDRMDRHHVLMLGLVLLIAADLVLAGFSSWMGVTLGIALWGLHMGFTQGIFATLVADAAPADLRGTAFGVFNLVSGLALLIASVTAGVLWDGFGPAATFLTGAGLTALALLALIWMHRSEGRS